MARPIWTGSISFGLVNIPVRLHTARASHDIAFHEYEERTGARIHHRRVSESSGREVPFEKIVKGLEVSKGKVVTLEREELEAIEPQKSRTLEIEEFVDLHDIDPILWDQTYYVAPDPKAGAKKSYDLLRRAMEEMGKVGVGKFVMRTKEYLATIRPLDGGLALETMFYPDEIRDQKELGEPGARVTVSAKELALAKQLVESLTAKWDPERFKDTYRDRVMDLVRKKGRGEEIPRAEGPERGAEVIDLMDALKASLNRDRKKGPARAASPTGRRHTGASRSRTGAHARKRQHR